MQLSDLIDAVRNNLNEAGITSMFSDANITEWLNAGARHAATILPPDALPDLQASASGTAASLTLPSGYFKAVQLLISNRRAPVITPNMPGHDPGHSIADFDLYGLLWGDTITFYPTGVTSYTFYYLKTPSDMSASTDEPDIPSMYHYALVYYAVYMAASKDRMLRTQYLDMFERTLLGGSDERKGND